MKKEVTCYKNKRNNINKKSRKKVLSLFPLCHIGCHIGLHRMKSRDTGPDFHKVFSV